MEKQQELEWIKAQTITISVNLIAAAKQQLRFLAEVDRHQEQYGGPALDLAIYRYKFFWLPLLAMHEKTPLLQGPFVVPLDCEWVWHCHRLNPVQYMKDCRKLFGKILGNKNVASSTQDICKTGSEEVWNRMYPNEPYELNTSILLANDNVTGGNNRAQISLDYDLVSAVKRQSSFYYQVSRPHMNDHVFLEQAVARYKGFLYLIKRNCKDSVKHFSVPTYDIDLIWHSHQLNPVCYYEDMMGLIGRVLEHDDTDSDRSKGMKLDVGFSGTCKQWEETFGSRYRRAGALYRGSAPVSLETELSQADFVTKKKGFTSTEYQNVIRVPNKMLVEVLLEIVDIMGVPPEHDRSLFVVFRKKQPDQFFHDGRRLCIQSSSTQKDPAAFQCEPNGELLFELFNAKPVEILGTVSVSVEEITKSGSLLSIEKWFELETGNGSVSSKPVSMRIALSFTPPVQAPFLLQSQMIRTHQLEENWTYVMDNSGNRIISLQMRDKEQNNFYKHEVIGRTASAEERVLAEYNGTEWSLMDSTCWFKRKLDNHNHVFELESTHDNKVIIFPGHKWEYENLNYDKQKREQDFVTAVEFSREHPYGTAVALFDFTSMLLKIEQEWFVLAGILSTFLLSNTMNKEVSVDCGFNTKTFIRDEPDNATAVKSGECVGNCSSCKTDDIMNSGSCGGGCGGGCSSACGSCGGGGGCGSGGGWQWSMAKDRSRCQ